MHSAKRFLTLPLLLLSGHLELSSAAFAQVAVEPLKEYAGSLRMTGTVSIEVARDVDRGTINIIDYDFSGADARCNNHTSLPLHGCRFAIHKGVNCSQLGVDLWVTELDSTDNPWSDVRYVVEPDGKSVGFDDVASGLSQLAMFEHAFAVTDFDGVPVACGVVNSRCTVILGICFQTWSRVVTGVAAGFAVISSFWLIRKHLLYNKNPILCKYTARILLMVPIYSVQAFISLWLKIDATTAEIMRFFREFYEAIVILSFLEFILVCVGGAESVIQRFDGNRSQAGQAGSRVFRHPAQRARDEERGISSDSPTSAQRREKLRHIIPWKWVCPRWRSARQMLKWCTLGTLSYVFAGMLVPTVVLICRIFVPHESLEIVIQVGKTCFMVTSMLAINALFELGHLFIHDLQDLSPFAKFASVKMVIFFTFWQGLVLTWLDHLGTFQNFLDARHHWNSGEQISQAIQHGAICIEMFAAAIVHHWAFPPSDYKIVKAKQAQIRSGTFSDAPVDTDVAVKRSFQVVDFRDLLAIGMRGFAPTHFVEKELDASSDSSEETETDLDTSDPDSPHAAHGKE